MKMHLECRNEDDQKILKKKFVALMQQRESNGGFIKYACEYKCHVPHLMRRYRIDKIWQFNKVVFFVTLLCFLISEQKVFNGHSSRCLLMFLMQLKCLTGYCLMLEGFFSSHIRESMNRSQTVVLTRDNIMRRHLQILGFSTS